MEMILTHLSMVMIMGKESIRKLDMLELRYLENLLAISLKRMDGEN